MPASYCSRGWVSPCAMLPSLCAPAPFPYLCYFPWVSLRACDPVCSFSDFISCLAPPLLAPCVYLYRCKPNLNGLFGTCPCTRALHTSWTSGWGFIRQGQCAAPPGTQPPTRGQGLGPILPGFRVMQAQQSTEINFLFPTFIANTQGYSILSR